jgi:hypothetical protein
MLIVYAFNHINYSVPNGEKVGVLLNKVSLLHAILNDVMNISGLICLFRSFSYMIVRM